jgi:hypothetical protein
MNLFRDYSQLLKEKHHVEVNQIKTELDQICPALKTSPTLSQKALRTIRSSGVDCTLVGMRNKAAVQDSVNLDPIPNHSVERILSSVKWDPIQFVEGNPHEE